MKKLILTIAVLAAGFGFSSAAQASAIVGIDVIGGAGFTTVPASNLAGATSLTGSYATSAGGIIDFSGSPAAAFGSATIDFTASGAAIFTFSAAGYGTFTSSAFNYDFPSPVNRSIQIQGTFAPAFGGFSASQATFTATFSQPAGAGAGNVILLPGGAVLTANGVPEPATLVMLGTFLVPAGIGLIRHRRRSRAK
jgi:hypothetical protein